MYVGVSTGFPRGVCCLHHPIPSGVRLDRLLGRLTALESRDGVIPFLVFVLRSGRVMLCTGFRGDECWSEAPCQLRILSRLGKPIIRVGLVGVTMRSNTHSLALPIATSSQGYSAGFRGTCIDSRFTEVDGQSRSWGAAILSHPRGGNCAHHRTPSCHREDRFLPCLPSFTLFHMISVERVALAALHCMPRFFCRRATSRSFAFST